MSQMDDACVKLYEGTKKTSITQNQIKSVRRGPRKEKLNLGNVQFIRP